MVNDNKGFEWELYSKIILPNGKKKILTEAQTKSLEPIYDDQYRLYRWECSTCGKHGEKARYETAISDGITHGNNRKHKFIVLRGGNFAIKKLGEKN